MYMTHRLYSYLRLFSYLYQLRLVTASDEVSPFTDEVYPLTALSPGVSLLGGTACTTSKGVCGSNETGRASESTPAKCTCVNNEEGICMHNENKAFCEDGDDTKLERSPMNKRSHT